ncbi:GlsB/YeaQ/YmgE family stress response membrane protein [Cohaesibacter marisflavi]|uniref:GlsB/YeaQ/YmgE family stress response membrane protein n=1 Tax=Cohaesibacter marisflavi TaxID=655353 RepID=UPI0029C8DE7F|nr:GlsB/YeaQ/YmgE family stress response membrane protein [Cohaesibacter marisflavi]
MNLIFWIVVGIVAGYIAEKVTDSDHGLLTNLIVGLIGSFVGGFIAQRFLPGLMSLTGSVWIDTIIIATLGAILVLFVYQKVRS